MFSRRSPHEVWSALRTDSTMTGTDYQRMRTFVDTTGLEYNSSGVMSTTSTMGQCRWVWEHTSNRKGKAALQEDLRRENCKVKRFDRKFNASDMLSHCPSAEELRKFLPMFGCHTVTEAKENFHSVEMMVKGMLAAKVTVFFASLAETLNS